MIRIAVNHPVLIYVVLTFLVSIVSGFATGLSWEYETLPPLDVLGLCGYLSVVMAAWVLGPSLWMIGLAWSVRWLVAMAARFAWRPASSLPASVWWVRFPVCVSVIALLGPLAFIEGATRIQFEVTGIYLSLALLAIAGAIQLVELGVLCSNQQLHPLKGKCSRRTRSINEIILFAWFGATVSLAFHLNAIFLMFGEISMTTYPDEFDPNVVAAMIAFAPATLFLIFYPLSRAYVARQMR